jgi:DNA-binding NarL/FixJ family response regulator
MSQGHGRALVIEDDASWRDILREILGDSGLVVDSAADLRSALAALRAQSYRLAVVDLSLGGTDHHNQDGLQALAAIRQIAPGCVAILLTGYATVELAVSAITEQGAFTCLRKEIFSRSEFRKVIAQALAQAMPDASGAASALTERERDVLAILITGKSNKDIAASLVISPNTVKRHLKAIFAKLGVRTRAAAVAAASAQANKPLTG